MPSFAAPRVQRKPNSASSTALAERETIIRFDDADPLAHIVAVEG